jgi:PLP dependent protein
VPGAAAQQIAANYQQVCRTIAAAAREPVTLVCVTKYARDEWVDALLDAGAEHLAENLLPQAAERFDRLTAGGRRFTRHLIGAQQSRKLKLIPRHFDWLQALDRRSSAQALNELLQASDAMLNTLVQVNIGAEPQKHGFPPAGLAETVSWLASDCPRLTLRGLMAVPPGPEAYATDAEFEPATRAYFRQMRAMFDKMPQLCGALPRWDTLSLGMSLDYLWAVEAGATMVRVGGALFAGLEG